MESGLFATQWRRCHRAGDALSGFACGAISGGGRVRVPKGRHSGQQRVGGSPPAGLRSVGLGWRDVCGRPMLGSAWVGGTSAGGRCLGRLGLAGRVEEADAWVSSGWRVVSRRPTLGSARAGRIASHRPTLRSPLAAGSSPIGQHPSREAWTRHPGTAPDSSQRLGVVLTRRRFCRRHSAAKPGSASQNAWSSGGQPCEMPDQAADRPAKRLVELRWSVLARASAGVGHHDQHHAVVTGDRFAAVLVDGSCDRQLGVDHAHGGQPAVRRGGFALAVEAD